MNSCDEVRIISRLAQVCAFKLLKGFVENRRWDHGILSFGRKTRAQFFLLCFTIFLQASDFRRQLLLKRFNFFELSRDLRLLDFAFEKQFFFGNSRFEGRIDFRELFFLIVGQGNDRLILRESLHRQLVGRFHFKLFLFLSILVLLLLLLSIDSIVDRR